MSRRAIREKERRVEDIRVERSRKKRMEEEEGGLLLRDLGGHGVPLSAAPFPSCRISLFLEREISSGLR